jgi:hypothetical protein
MKIYALVCILEVSFNILCIIYYLLYIYTSLCYDCKFIIKKDTKKSNDQTRDSGHEIEITLHVKIKTNYEA